MGHILVPCRRGDSDTEGFFINTMWTTGGLAWWWLLFPVLNWSMVNDFDDARNKDEEMEESAKAFYAMNI